MLNKNTKIIPVVTGALGSILQSLENHFKNITISPNITTLQKSPLLETARIPQRVLSVWGAWLDREHNTDTLRLNN